MGRTWINGQPSFETSFRSADQKTAGQIKKRPGPRGETRAPSRSLGGLDLIVNELVGSGVGFGIDRYAFMNAQITS